MKSFTEEFSDLKCDISPIVLAIRDLNRLVEYGNPTSLGANESRDALLAEIEYMVLRAAKHIQQRGGLVRHRLERANDHWFMADSEW